MSFIIFTVLLFSETLNLDSQGQYLQELNEQISGFYSSFTGNLTLISDSGSIISGKIYYQYPNKLRVKLSNDQLIITNGKFLWMCKPSTLTCFKQDVDGSSGGLVSILKTFHSRKQGKYYIFNNTSDNGFKRIVVHPGENMLKSVRLETNESKYTVNFSNLIINTSLKSSLFYYKNSNAQIVENPLNN